MLYKIICWSGHVENEPRKVTLFRGIRTTRGDNQPSRYKVKGFDDLDSPGVIEFVAQFGGDYVVRRASARSLTFDEVYRNNSFVVYKVGRATP